MFEIIRDMPEGTIGLAARGAITASDCERTLLRLVADHSAPDEHTRMLLLFGEDFQDFRVDALGANAQFAFNRWGDFRRLAIVSDVPWLRKAVRLLAPFMRGELRIFHDYEIEQAKTWIAAEPGGQSLACSTPSASR